MKKIAIIEDNFYFANNLSQILVIKNFKTEVFKSLKEAENGLEKFNPDLIITDLTLPDGNGQDIIEKLRQNSFYHHIPIIIITGTPDIKPIDQLSLGVYKVLTKPVATEILLLNIKKALNKREKYLKEKKILTKAKKIFLFDFLKK